MRWVEAQVLDPNTPPATDFSLHWLQILRFPLREEVEVGGGTPFSRVERGEKREGEVSGVSSYKATNATRSGPHPYDLIST